MNADFNIEEPIVWTRDRAPKRSFIIEGIVLQGTAQTTSAGAIRAPIAADAWKVVVEPNVGIVSDIREGDSLKRLNSGEMLVVQDVTKTEIGWIINCTANVRCPR